MDYKMSHKTTRFMDLTVTINDKNCLVLMKFCKEMALNLHLLLTLIIPLILFAVLLLEVFYFLHNKYIEDFETECVSLVKDLSSSG